MSSNSKNLCKLFDIVFHQLLYINSVYIKDSFECHQVENIQTWKCMHPGVCKYFYNFLAVAEEYFNQCVPIQIVFELKKYPDIILDEYVFHICPSEQDMNRTELIENIVDIILSLEAIVLDEGMPLCSDGEELTYSLHIRQEDSDMQFPLFDQNSSAVFIRTSGEECPRILPMKRINTPE